MAAPSRTAQFTRLHKVLKKHYQPVAPDPNRSVLEHLLFACCLENAHYAAAEEAFAAMVHTFFDWNEIRVSSVRELSEVIAGLPDPPAAASRFKRILQSTFEATYAFDLEDLRKLNLGPAVERLEKIEGTTKFSTAYVVQAALGGHSIPLDSGTLGALALVDLVTEADVAAGVVPGLERAIAKNVGIEFGSLVHQLGADFVAAPFAPPLHAILLEIDPTARDRLPSRRAKKPEPARPAAPAGERRKKEEKPKKEPAAAGTQGPEAPHAAAESPAEAKKKPAAGKKKADTPADVRAADGAGRGTEPPGAEGKAPRPAESPPGESPAKRKERPEGSQEEPVGEKPPAKRPAKKKPETRAKEEAGAVSAPSPAEGLSKRKPR